VAGAFSFVLDPGRRLLAWWLRELGAMVPARLRQRLVPAKDMLVLLFEDGAVWVGVESGRDLEEVGQLDLTGDPQPQHTLEALLRNHGLGGFRAAALRLRGGRALHTIIDLPLAAEQNLSEVVAFELDRHTPFRADEARFAHRIIERDPAAKKLRVELTVVPRPVIDDLVAASARVGIVPTRIEVADDASFRAASGNLLPAQAATPDWRRRDKPSLALAAGAAALAIVAIYLPLQATQRADEAIDEQAAATRKSMATIAALQKEIEALRKDEGFLADRKRERPTVSALLLEVTQILPDDAYLLDWELDGGEIQIQGLAASASTLVRQLEQSHEFRDTTFQSPVVQDARTGRERFHIATQIVTAQAKLAQDAAQASADGLARDGLSQNGSVIPGLPR
jgi:general secretion pathway protein L